MQRLFFNKRKSALHHNAGVDKPPDSGRGRRKLGLLWCLFALASFSWFLFANVTGDFGFWGDDSLILIGTGNLDRPYSHIVSSRGFLTPYYMLVLRLAGGDLAAAHRFSFALYLTGAVVGFFLLRRFLGDFPALMGALFYLSYPAKHEIVTWISAGAYLLIILVFLISVWIAASSRLSLWSKGFWIAVLNWAAAHLVEILIIAAPLYPILELLRRRLRRERLFTVDWAATFLPLAAFLIHAAVIVATTQRLRPGAPPIWMRLPGFPQEPAGILSWALKVFGLGISGAFGRNYLGLTRYCSFSFFQHVPFTAPLVAAAAGSIVGIAGAWRARSDSALTKQTPQTWPVAFWLCVACGLYLALFSHMVGLTITGEVMVSRLLTLNGLGLSVLCAAVAYVATRLGGRWRLLLFVIVAGVFVQGAAMHSIFYEHQTKWAFDSSVLRQITGSGARIMPGDSVFVSFPRPYFMRHYWHVGFSQLEHASFGLLLAAEYQKGKGPAAGEHLNRYRYLHDGRQPGENQVNADMDELLSAGGRMFPFFLRESDQRVFGISRLRYLSVQGENLAEYDFSSVWADASISLLAVEGKTVAIGKRFPDGSLPLNINLWREGLALRMQWQQESIRKAVRLELVQGGRPKTSILVAPGGVREWVVPLASLEPHRSVRLRALDADGRPAPVPQIQLGLVRKNL